VDWYFATVHGQLAEIAACPQVWWAPLADGKMVSHIPISGYVYSHPILWDGVM